MTLFPQYAAVQFFGNGLGQIVTDKLFDNIPLMIHDAVDTEIQIGVIELEEFAQEFLKLSHC